MTALAERLAVIAADGAVASWAELTNLQLSTTRKRSQRVRSHRFSPKPLPQQAALVHQADGASANFVTGLSNQTSLLALASSLEDYSLALSPFRHRVHACTICRPADGLAVAIADTPLLAAGRLEGAVRLAVANAVTPFAVLGRLTSLSEDVPEEFAERLPRLLGAAMDRWADNSAFVEPIRQALDQLRHHEAAAVDAMFELACDHLRTALSAETLPAAMESLTTARAGFATVDAAEEARHDARAYAAAWMQSSRSVRRTRIA